MGIRSRRFLLDAMLLGVLALTACAVGKTGDVQKEWNTTLRELGTRGLSVERAPLGSLPPDLLEPLVDIAWDANRPIDARRTAALLAARSPHASAALLAGLGAVDAEEDAIVGNLALRAGAFHGSPGLQEALHGALRSPSAELRLGALRTVGTLRTRRTAAVERQLEALAANDGDERVREEAQRVLEGGADH